MTPTSTTNRSTLRSLVRLVAATACLLAIAAVPGSAQDICIETAIGGGSPIWEFHITGSSGDFRSLAGFRRAADVPADGSLFLDSGSGIATVRWTSHFGNFGEGNELRLFRCDISFDLLTGDGERVDIRAGQDPETVTGTCDLVTC